MPNGVVRWPEDGVQDRTGVAAVTVSYNTAWLSSLLLWSLYQVLEPGTAVSRIDAALLIAACTAQRPD